MGSGCSSPLKRFGGKRAKSRRESSNFEIQKDDDAQNEDQSESQPHNQQPIAKQKFIMENEITLQSEANDDHPSTASYYTDGRIQSEEYKQASNEFIIEKSKTTASESSGINRQLAKSTPSSSTRPFGLNGTYVPIDRHLLVSPALSPAPSTCHSPSPANSNSGYPTTILDIFELNEAFKTLTFGLPKSNLKTRIKHPPERQQTDLLHNYYTHQQLVQDQCDLIDKISVVFIATNSSSTHQWISNDQKKQNDFIELSVASKIESSIRAFCDEHTFNLRFLNLTNSHLSKNLLVNNLVDASMNILEKENRDNGHRLTVIVLSNNMTNSNGTSIGEESSLSSLDTKHLPTKIEAQTMNKLLNLDLSALSIEDPSKFNELVRRWYCQIGNIYHLQPIYAVNPKILSGIIKERYSAWQDWTSDSNYLKKAFALIAQYCSEFAESPEIKLKHVSNSQLEFITKDPQLLKRTLLIRNYSCTITSETIQPPSQAQGSNQSSQRFQAKDNQLNELARSLPDQNKLTLKRALSPDELIATTSDWVVDNSCKFIEIFRENQIAYGKQIPPFIERNLFIELSNQRITLEQYLDNISENFETKCLNFYTSHMKPILAKLLENSIEQVDSSEQSAKVLNIECVGSQSPEPRQMSTNHLVFISGPRGCGKSTLFAQIVKLAAQDLFYKAQIIYRFCGISLDSLSSNRLLRSICEQFCQTQGENITAASYIYSNQRKEIIDALNKIIKLQNTLIFLDGIDRFDSQATNSNTSLEWLCELQANPRIKIFITLETDSQLYKRVLSSYSDATFISLDNPSINEWAQMLSVSARSKRLNSSTNLYDEIKNLDAQKTSNNHSKGSDSFDQFTYRHVSDIINMCQIRRLNNEFFYPELSSKIIQATSNICLKNIKHIIIDTLQYLITPSQLCALIIAMRSARNGLVETDIVNIMAMISSSQKTTSATTSGQVVDSIQPSFSSTLFSYIKIHLQPWLVYIFRDRVVKITLQKDFSDAALEFYNKEPFTSVINETREMLLEYFRRGGIKSTRPSIINAIKGDSLSVDQPKDKINAFGNIRLASQISETIHLLISSNPSKAKECLLNKHQFFLQFLYGSMPEEFIEDYERLKASTGRKSSFNEEMQFLVDYIRQSVFPLRYDGYQIYSQIYCRTFEANKMGKYPKGRKFADLLTVAACPPIYQLIPVSEVSIDSFIRARIGSQKPSSADTIKQPTSKNPSDNNNNNNNLPHSGPPQSASSFRQKIFSIKDNHKHVIVIQPDKGSLCVWDIYEERAVRVINNIDQPRDLRMIDQKRAVVLCNRELRVYDLDSGVMVTKLKGVMNQKMPFFEVYGDNYVVTLARNRMYVNMLNLNTGELETTFKVGEDRFLNSLLVSANGGVCVCGDETQKPFPLLVWNLNERRLMYDLRLDRHEFITKMSAISDDGHFVVSVCRQLGDSNDQVAHGNDSGIGSADYSSSSLNSQPKHSPNFIIIYDLNSGTLFKKWKPGLDTCAVAISISAEKSGKVINSIVDNSILVWDLSTGSKRHTLKGHSAPADVLRVQNHRLFSMDSTGRDQSLRVWDIEEGYCLAVFSPDAPVSCCQISTRGDALVCGFMSESRLSTLILCKNETVNEVVKRNKRRKSSKSLYIFDEPTSRKSSS